MHRTQTEFEDNLTFKVFIFQFINFYSSIFYIAFFKGRFVGYPGNYKHIVGTLRNEDVSPQKSLVGKLLRLQIVVSMLPRSAATADASSSWLSSWPSSWLASRSSTTCRRSSSPRPRPGGTRKRQD